MRNPPAVRARDIEAGPLDLLVQAPANSPLVLLHSGSAGACAEPDASSLLGSHDGPGRWNRWSIIARPERWFVLDEAACRSEPDPLRRVDELIASTRRRDPTGAPEGLPFLGGWIGYFSYDLARFIEPAASSIPRPAGERPWPLVALARCPRALVHDHATGAWYEVGDLDDETDGRPAGRPAGWPAGADERPDPTWTVGPWQSSLTPDAYRAAVERTLEYIAAGDIFQASIAQRLTASFGGSSRGLARRALTESTAWYGAYLELPHGRSALSMSPELFLEIEAATRRAVTRPIKGTRPGHLDPGVLLDSEKDAAELHMIVDLMRNDLGRVAEYGSVRVQAPRTIETHRTVHHGVGEVVATLREGVSIGDLLLATFPGGSVTGAPKIRAMQIIEELEPVRRGPYCGAFGCVSDTGDACFNIGIRTMLLSGQREADRFDRLDGVIDYSVGSGIVADSDPLSEHRECLDKAAVLRLATDGSPGDTPASITPATITPPVARSAGPR